jgi:hypothetical protein
VLVGETFGDFSLDDQHIFHEDIGKVFSHPMPLIRYWKWDFGMSRTPPVQGVGHLENTAEHRFRQGGEVSALISVHRRPIRITVPFPPKALA